MKLNDNLKFPLFWVSVTFVYCLIFTSIELSDNPIAGIHGFLHILGHYMVIVFASAGFIGVLALNKWIFSFGFPLAAMMSAAIAYYRITMNVSFTPVILELAVINDTKTCLSVIDRYLVLSLIAALTASTAIAYIRFKYIKLPLKSAWKYLICFIAVISLSTVVIDRFRRPVISRLPYSLYFVPRDYLLARQEVKKTRHAFDNINAEPADTPPDIIVILGESLRADHLPGNGYNRPTTPKLSGEDNIVYLPNVTTPYCFTHTSIPHIVTRADTANPEIAYAEPSFITLFKKSGYHTSWLTNQDSANSYVFFMNEADSLIYSNSAHNLYDYGEWYDSDLLPHIKRVLDADKGQPSFMAVHTIGSHWWYKSHYPDSLAVFKPETDSRILSELSHEQIVNSYDNTIVATDSFIHSVISMLRKRNALLFYISDHGESLGENGNYLHKGDFPEVRDSACFVWYSDTYASIFPDKVAALKQNSERKWITDMVFHSAVDAAGIKTPVLDSLQSIFHSAGPLNGNR